MNSFAPVETHVGIVDVGIANLGSIRRILGEIATHTTLIRGPGDLKGVDRIVLPGVGSFAEGMARLRYSHIAEMVRAAAAERTPILGICLGMQLLADSGEEHGHTEGLGLIGGTVKRMNESHGIRVPHVGWNSVKVAKESMLLRSVEVGSDFYFTHSFVFSPADDADIVGVTAHGEEFCAAVERENIMGVQFHPEKSSIVGQTVLRNFCTFTVC